MFLTRKRIILICSIIVVYGATIVVDLFRETKPIVVDNIKSTLPPQNDNDIIQTSLSQPLLTEKESISQAAKKENVMFDITQQNNKIFLALSTHDTKIENETVSFPSDNIEKVKENALCDEEIKTVEEIAFSGEKNVSAKNKLEAEEKIVSIKNEVEVEQEIVSIENEVEVEEEIIPFKAELSQQFHIVTFGDSLWKISKKYYKKNAYKDIQKGVFALAGANPQIINIDKLNVDTQIFIPLASNVNLYYKKYLYNIQLSKEIQSSKTISKVE